jgi:hypothetical protein
MSPRIVTVAATLLVLLGAASMPVANAAPKPGGDCTATLQSNGSLTSPDGTLECNGMTSTWMDTDMSHGVVGQPCDRPGAQAFNPHSMQDGVSTCRSGSSGLTWQP